MMVRDLSPPSLRLRCVLAARCCLLVTAVAALTGCSCCFPCGVPNICNFDSLLCHLPGCSQNSKCCSDTACGDEVGCATECGDAPCKHDWCGKLNPCRLYNPDAGIFNFCVPPACINSPSPPPPGRFFPVPVQPVFAPRQY